ncbi:MAG: hypothetical protein A3H61_02595 [Candidatus Jacksonbacteria bacterium RIFCSPLOWO2_02_FULL_44_20]|uniref:Glutamine--fructose-6-phosphate aminotransferase [isomerizing] n=1 Tax=Candidatus Jacksonbacteria bacterium RIFCSPLOWO2_02_FULL_44_20 TaxID=1798460 RepID=A0A1G2AAG0_9BACT|nr:MAG: hypothetical protein A3H61_02595 [Candidatus Jacksonbacteria bacterium RIFCSPLOWO2_02_FULL_44_20]
MCGIIGYSGPRSDAVKLVVLGLKKLEYRGYDSWGVGYVHADGTFGDPVKEVGAVGELSSDSPVYKRLTEERGAFVVIGHTRWATTGRVNKINAHPHFSNTGRIAIVQNGIVENFSELKKFLTAKGFHFKSETDTEVIVNFIEYELNRLKRKDTLSAVRSAFRRLLGRNAIVAIFEETGEMIIARSGSPLIIGVGKNEYFVASDIPAFLPYTNKVIYLDDGQIARIKKKEERAIEFYDIKTGKEIHRRVVTVDLKPESVDKGKFKHFMIKEIMEQKDTIRRAVQQDDGEIIKIARMIKRAYGTFSVACGTAGYASMVGEYLFSQIAQKHINFVVASEFGSYKSFLTARTLMLVTSQSGETADVLEAMKTARSKKVRIVSLVNVPDSSVAKESDYTFCLNAGPERAVASTKAYTAQIALHTMLAYAAAGRLQEAKQILINAAGHVNDMLNPRYERYLHDLARRLKNSADMYVIGRGLMYPVALEIALKIKEVSYIHADGLPGGELKHGTLALITKDTPCIVVVANDENKRAILSNAQEVKARGGYIIGISPENNSVFDSYIRVPDAGMAAPIVSIIPGQILAYHFAVLRGLDPDKPRNLAKSVTVK